MAIIKSNSASGKGIALIFLSVVAFAGIATAVSVNIANNQSDEYVPPPNGNGGPGVPNPQVTNTPFASNSPPPLDPVGWGYAQPATFIIASRTYANGTVYYGAYNTTSARWMVSWTSTNASAVFNNVSALSNIAVFVASGTYNLLRPLKMDLVQNQTWIGSGRTVLNMSASIATPIIDVWNSTQITLQYLTTNHNSPQGGSIVDFGAGIDLINSSYVNIFRCQVTKSSNYNIAVGVGFETTYTASGYWAGVCNYTTIQECIVTNSPKDGIHIAGGYGNRILNNVIYNCTDDLIALDATQAHPLINTVVSGNSLANTTYNGIKVMCTYGVVSNKIITGLTIENNYLTNIGNVAIFLTPITAGDFASTYTNWVTWLADCKIIGNTVTDSLIGIYTSTITVLLSNLNIQDNWIGNLSDATGCLTLFYATNSIISNNVLVNCPLTSALSFTGLTNSSVMGNSVKDFIGSHGMYFYNVTFNSISANSVINCDDGIFFDDYCTYNTVTNNILSGFPESAVVLKSGDNFNLVNSNSVFDWDITATKNAAITVYGSYNQASLNVLNNTRLKGSGFSVTGDSNRFVGNIINTNPTASADNQAFYVSGDSNSIISNTVIGGNNQGGIILDGSTGNIVQDNDLTLCTEVYSIWDKGTSTIIFGNVAVNYGNSTATTEQMHDNWWGGTWTP